MDNHVTWVVAAILKDTHGRILIAQRPEGKSHAGLWEFPGGKVEPNEDPETALVRELKEELGITVAPTDLIPLTFVSYRYPHYHMVMLVYSCEVWQGEVYPCEGQGGLAWIEPNTIEDYPLPAADLPLIPLLKSQTKR